MRALLRVELARMRWRRAVFLLVGAALVVTVIVIGVLLHDTRPGGFSGPLDLRAAMTDTSIGIATLLTVVGMLIGTTFAGHDWTTGSMTNQLLFEPRRGLVWWSKALVVAVVAVVLSVLVLALLWVVLILVAHHRDLPVPGSVVSAIVHQTIRLSLVAGLGSVGAYALTMAFRSTVATLGFLFAVAIAGPILLAVLSAPGWIQPQNQYAAIADDGYDSFDYTCSFISYDQDGPIDGDPCVTHLDQHDGWLYFGVIIGVAVVGSTISFGRRDVS